MTHCSPRSSPFILEAFDCDLWCPVAQTLFHVADIGSLRSILKTDAHKDPELDLTYELDDEQIAMLVAQFGVAFDRSQLESADLIIRLLRRRRLSGSPYLIHTGYELPLLLDGRKKLARMPDLYPPMTFDGEDRFDHWVAEGLLHREEVLEPFDSPVKGYLGVRTVYYTPKGEEWRIPASKLIWEASSKAGGWNGYLSGLRACSTVMRTGRTIGGLTSGYKAAALADRHFVVRSLRLDWHGSRRPGFVPCRQSKVPP